MMAKTSLPPGFRFHPTDVELVWYYLKRKVMGKRFKFQPISDVELYKFAPWDLPGKSWLRSKDLEWYFFCPRDKKYSQGSRTNRATDIGYWKTTGRDRSIVHNSQTVGMKKTLIFHLGKAPHGSRTDWVMYEFRLDSKELANAGYAQDAFVLCKIFQKSGPGPRSGEQYGAPFNEEDWDDDMEDVNPRLFPPASSTQQASLCLTLPQPGAPETGDTQRTAEIGEPSCIPECSGVGELSKTNGASAVGEHSYVSCEVGEPSYVPELSYSDCMLMEQLEEFLNSSPTQTAPANTKASASGCLLDDAVQAPDMVFDNVYDNLVNLSTQPFPEHADRITPSGNMSYDFDIQSALAEFENEHYMELSDFHTELAPPGDQHRPVADNAASYGLSDYYIGGDEQSHLEGQLQYGVFGNYQFPPNAKDRHPP